MKIIVNKILGTVSLLLLCNKAEKYPKKIPKPHCMHYASILSLGLLSKSALYTLLTQHVEEKPVSNIALLDYSVDDFSPNESESDV